MNPSVLDIMTALKIEPQTPPSNACGPKVVKEYVFMIDLYFAQFVSIIDCPIICNIPEAPPKTIAQTGFVK